MSAELDLDLFGGGPAPEPAATEPKTCPTPYATAAAEYLRRGWWPIYSEGGTSGKDGIPPGFTGYTGQPVRSENVARWASSRPAANIAIRLPPDVIAVDVDDYGDKPGAETLAELEERLGPLPPTWVATARPLPSGKRLYRVPNGSRLRKTMGPGIDVCQFHHRYVLVAPSTHHHTGAPVHWVDMASGEVDYGAALPEPGDLPELPWAWLEEFSASGTVDVGGVASDQRVRDWAENGTSSTRPGWCDAVIRAVEADIARGVSRHDTMQARLCQVAREVAAGGYTADAAITSLRAIWNTATRGEGREREFDDMLAWAVGQLDTDAGREQVEEKRRRLAETGGHEEIQLADRPTAASGQLGLDRHHRVSRGGAFVYDVPETPPSIWGTGDQVLWAQGEGLLVAGPTGVGKSTLVAQLVAGRVGIVDQVLGHPISAGRKPVLYLAMDRPVQIRRLLHRYFRHHDARAILDEQLIVWSGPLPATLNANPGVIVDLALELGVGTVVVDSLKDAAVKLTDDESGGNINRAFQEVTAESIDLVVLHHQRKAVGDGGKAPKSLDDIYGSALIPAGMGSVLSLWGQAGDPIVELLHLKQPLEQLPPTRIEHDNVTGSSSIVAGFDPLAYLRGRGVRGSTAKEAAVAMFEKQSPTPNEVAKAKRQLERLHRSMPDQVERSSPRVGGDGGQEAVRFTYVDVIGPATQPATQGVST